MGVLKMPFEVYKPRGERVPKLPLVTISKNSIVLNKHAREKLGTEKVELAYDVGKNVIRIKATEDGQNIKKTKVFSRGFFNHFNLAAKGKYQARYEEKENALYVDLD
jgi:ribosome-binding protein aMBF1 (putative translation factor)